MSERRTNTAINITKISSPSQINAINDNFKKIQQQIFNMRDYLEPMAKAGKDVSDKWNNYFPTYPPVSTYKMETYAQKRINMGPEPPEEPIEGEVWFVTDENGEVIAIRHWDGTQWVDDVDNVAVQQAIDEANQAAASAQQVGEQAQQTADQAAQVAQAAQAAADAATQAANNAQADADDAKTQAQNAVDTANQASTDATNAINQAQSAFDNAQNALTTASNAMDTANSASQVASDAATQASSAWTQAQSAFDSAQDALQKATDAENALDTKVDTAQYQTDLQNLQSDIAEKADVTWVNGQLVLKEDAIVKSNTAPTSPKNGQVWLDTSVSPAIVKYWDSTNAQWVKATPTEAGEVGAYTITEVDNALNGKVSVTTYQTDMNNVVTRLDNAESSIQQNADSIALKVDKTTYDADINDETNGLKTRMSNAETAITQNANAIELKASQTDLDALNDTVTDIHTSVSQLTVNVDNITTRVTTNEGDISSLQQTANSLTSRISTAEGNISTLQQTSDSFATRISTAEGNISTLTQTTQGLQTTVSGKVDKTEYNSFVTQTNQALQSKLSITDAANTYATQSALTQTANSLTSSITAVQTDLNNLQIGGRNLLKGTSGDWTTLNMSESSYYYQKGTDTKLEAGKTYTFSILVEKVSDDDVPIYINIGTGLQGSFNRDKGARIPIEFGKRYTVTFTITENDIANGYEYFAWRLRNEKIATVIKYKEDKLELGNRATDWTPAPEDMATVTQFNTLSQTLDSTVSRIGNAEGNISALQQTATSLTARIGDAENNISTLQQTASSLGTRITDAEGDISTLTQTVDGLQTTVSDVQGDVSTLTQTADSLQSRMTTAEGNISTLTQTTDSLTTQISAKADQSWVSSQISQLSDDINLRVEKDDIINQINLSTEGVLIDGAKVHITGQTTIDDAVIKDAMIASLTASKLTAGTIDASVITVKNINASNIITGTLDASKVTVTNIDASKINTGTLNAARIAAGSIGASKLNVSTLSAISANLGNVTAGTINGVTIKGGTITSSDATNGTVTIQSGQITSTSPGDPQEVVTKKAMITNGTIGIYNYPADIPTSNMHTEINVTGISFENDVSTAKIHLNDTKGNLVVEVSSLISEYVTIKPMLVADGWVGTDAVDSNPTSSGLHVYIRPKSGGEVRATVTGTTNNYVSMRAKEYNPPNSLREMKKNIEEFTDDVLDTFRNVKTYTFNYNFEEDGAKKTLGLMLDEAPEIIWNASGDSIDMYSSIGYLYTGVKQTVSVLDNHESRLSDLLTRVENLERTISA